LKHQLKTLLYVCELAKVLLNMTDYYMTRTEEEMGKGFVDLYLEKLMVKQYLAKQIELIG